MAKLKNPFNSFGAHGSIGRVLSVRRRLKEHIAQSFPDHPDANTTPQQAQRLMFQMCRDLWHTLSQSEKAAWESLARPFHMTGYSYYLSQCLRPNPGIYLPLAGGTMQGAINMDTNRITDLPAPGANSDPARKTELDAHAALTSGVHGLLGNYSFLVTLSSNQSIPTGVATKVSFNSTYFDHGSRFNTSLNRWVAPFNCLLFTSVVLYLSPLSFSSEHWRIYLYQSGFLFRRLHRYYVDSFPNTLTFPLLLSLATNAYIEIYVYHDSSAASETVYSSNSYTFWSGFVLSQSG